MYGPEKITYISMNMCVCASVWRERRDKINVAGSLGKGIQEFFVLFMQLS